MRLRGGRAPSHEGSDRGHAEEAPAAQPHITAHAAPSCKTRYVVREARGGEDGLPSADRLLFNRGI